MAIGATRRGRVLTRLWLRRHLSVVTENSPYASFVEVLRRRARARPDAWAYAFLEDGERERERLSFGELDRRARGIGAELQRRGLSGERVLLLYPSGLEFLCAFFGCLYAGATAVPVYPPRPGKPEPRLRAVLGDAEPRLALTEESLLSRIEATGSTMPELCGLPVIATSPGSAAAAGSWREPAVGPDDVAFLQYTSGSTSTPKGVMVTHGNLLANEEVIRASCHHDEGSTFVSWLPMYHDMGLIGSVLQPLFLGAACVLMAPVAFLQRPQRWLRAIDRYRGHTSGAPNFAYELCLRRIPPEERKAFDLSSWRVAFNGAEPVRADTVERFAEAFAVAGFRPEVFFPCYGLAEATLIVTGGPAGTRPTSPAFDARELEGHRVVAGGGDGPDRRVVGCGQTWGPHSVRVVDPDTATELPPDRVGEIWVSGPSVAAGYWGRPETTRETFHARLRGSGDETYLRTGDLGFVRDGELFVTGRLKDLVIIRGRNHYPQDLERTVEASHPALRPGSGAAFSVEVEGEERLVVVQEVRRRHLRGFEAEPVAAEVRRAVTEEHQLQIHDVVFLKTGSVFKTTSGKIQRSACRAAYLEGGLRTVGTSRLELSSGEEWDGGPGLAAEELVTLPEGERAPALTAELRRLAGRAARLDPATLRPGDRLVEWGLDSLAAVELAQAVESAFGVDVPLGDLLGGLTLGGLGSRVASAVEAAPAPRRKPLRQVSPSPPAPSGAGPLSAGQEGLFFIHGSAPESSAYHIAVLAQVEGILEIGPWRRALARLHDRHAALRTGFRFAEGRVRQEVEGGVAPDFEVVDAGGRSAEARSGWLEAETAAPFDLARPPLLRMRLARHPEGDLLLLVVHHIVADFWSLAVLAHDLGALYEQELGARPAPGPIRRGYSDFVRWQEAELSGPAGERHREHWRERLEGAPARLALPTDRPRTEAGAGRGGSRGLAVDPGLAERIAALGRARGATHNVTWLALFEVLLHRVTGACDLAVGAPATGRTAPGFEGVMGYFVNLLPLRSRPVPEERFGTFLERRARQSARDLEHQDLPFPEIVRRLGIERAGGEHPLCQVVFAFQRLPPGLAEGELAPFALKEGGGRVRLGERLALRSLPPPATPVQFDLVLRIAESGRGLRASLEYSEELFDASTARRLLDQLRTLAASVAREPERAIGELDLLAPTARHQLLFEAGRAASPWWPDRPRPVHELVAERAVREPDGVAIEADGAAWTYGALALRADRLAGRLRAAGARPGRVVAVCVERTPEMVTAWLAVLTAGAAYLPLDPRHPPERTADMLADAGARALVVRGGSPVPPREDLAVVDLAAGPDGGSDAGSAGARGPGAGADDLAYLIFTSGSTGRPKGVSIGYAGLWHLVRWHLVTYPLGPDDRAAQVAAPTFDAAVWEVWPVLAAGATLCLPGDDLRRDPRRLAEWLVARRVRQTFLPTLLAEAVLDHPWPRDTALRTLLTGGDRLRRGAPPELPFRLCNHYGPTEATVVTTHGIVPSGPSGRAPGEAPAIGRTRPGLRVQVVDRTGRPVPQGSPGELRIGGPGLARGYSGRPALTAEAFVPDPFASVPGERLYRTGDLVRFRNDLSLDFLSRADDQVQVRGVRIEPGEVEAVLQGHPGVRQAVVVPRRAGDGTTFLAAFVTPGDGAPDPETLWSHLRSRLPEAMVPASVTVLDELPTTRHGKVDRRRLPEVEPVAAAARDGSGEIRTPLEELVAGVWRRVLGLGEVGRRDDFFARGGHSLQAAQVAARLGEELGVEVPLRSLLEEPTVAGTAERLESLVAGSRAEADAPLVTTGDDGPLPLSIGQEWLWSLERLDADSAAYVVPLALRLEGALDAPALASALHRVVQRHESLRTSFPVVEGEPMQVVADQASRTLPVADLTGLAGRGAGREAALDALCRQVARHPIDLEGPGLVERLLVRLEADRHLLLVVLRHLVADGWSVGLLVDELTSAYGGLVLGLTPELPELPIQYRDFVAWERRRLVPEQVERDLGFWRRRLAGAESLALPADRPAAPGANAAGFTLRRHLGTPEAGELRALARRLGVTPFTVLLATFCVFLHRLTGSDDLAVGVPVSRRPRAVLERLVGLFVDTVVVRLDLAGQPAFREVVSRVRREFLEIQGHRDLPFPRWIGELEVAGGDGRLRLPALFAYQKAPVTATEAGGVRFVPGWIDRGASQAELVVDVEDRPEEMVLSLELSADRFDATTGRRLLELFGTLVRRVAAEPDRTVGRLDLATPVQRQQVLEWNGTAWPPVGRPERLERALAETAARWPDAVAVAGGGTVLTYGGLLRLARRLAGRLAAAGAGPERAVGVLLGRGAELPVALVGTWIAGAVVLPLDPELPDGRLRDVLAEVGGGREVPVIAEARNAERLRSLPARSVLLPGPEGPEGEVMEPVSDAGPEAAAYTIFTSGSTGRPKGVVVSHRSVLHQSRALVRDYRLGPGDRVLQFASPGFDMIFEELLPTWLVGAAAVPWPGDVAPPAAEMLDLIERESVTVVNFLASIWHEWVVELELSSRPLPDSLRLVVVGIEAVSAETVRRWRALVEGGAVRPEVGWRNAYGVTEATITTTLSHGASGELAGATAPIGYPVEGATVHLLDRYGAPVPPGVTGEMYLGGAIPARGYLGRPATTAARFVPDPFVPGRPGSRCYRTGDLARRLPSGQLEFLGRNDHQISLRGLRVEPGEVEAALAADPTVRTAAVAVVRVLGEPMLVAWAVPTEEGVLDPEAVRRRLGERLPRAMVPARIEPIDELPRGPSGKVDRRSLPISDVLDGLEGGAGGPARTPVEREIAGTWGRLLGTPEPGRRDDFFALGGSSLAAARLASRLSRSLGVEISVRDLFEASTPEALARRAEERLRRGGSALPPLEPRPELRDRSELPLSSAQRRLWFLDRLDPGSAAYHMPARLRLRGPLGRVALARATAAVRDRHQPLRASFVERRGVPVQVVLPRAPVALPVVDLAALPPSSRRHEAERLVRLTARRPFDLSRETPWRALLVAHGEADHSLAINLHHIAADGWSLEVLTRDLAALYAREVGEPATLPELPVVYADWTAWQESWLDGEVLEELAGFWRRRLEDLSTSDLPTDRPRGPKPSLRGELLHWRVPGLAAAVEELAHRRGVTPFMVLTAGLQGLISRLSGSDDVALGTPVANRPFPEVEDLVGLFINTLVLRGDLGGDPTFAELLARTRERTVEAYSHQAMPFERLVEELRPNRDLARSPLFGVMLALQQTAALKVPLRGLEAELEELPTGTSRFDLLLSLALDGPDLTGVAELTADLFDATTIRRLLRCFEELLWAAASDPERRLAEMPLLAAAEHHQVVAEGVAPEVPGGAERTVHRIVAERAAETPDAVAVSCGDRCLTYAGLVGRARALAQRLRALGVGTETRVGVCLHRDLRLPAALLGVLEAGGAYVALDPAYPEERLRFIREDADVRVLVTVTGLEERLGAETVPRVLLDALDALEEKAPFDEAPPAETDPRNAAYVLYTSGSTGRPKGVVIEHRSVAALLAWAGRAFTATELRRVLAATSINFDLSVFELFAPWSVGGTAVLVDDALALGRGPAVTLVNTVPSVLSEALRAAPLPPAVTTVCLAGEPLRRDLAERLHGPGVRRVVNLYGPSEDTTYSTVEVVSADTPGDPPIGRPVAGTGARVLEPGGGPAALGAPGELCLTGAGLARGYLGRPAATAERFVPDRFAAVPGARTYRTGDLARRLPDGRLAFLGRLDHQVKVRGFRIEPGEVEAALVAHPAVAEAAVTVHRGPRGEGAGDARLVAYLVAEKGAAPPTTEVRSFLQSRLPPYMVPGDVMVLEALPRTPSGKLDRRALPAPGEAERSPAAAYVAPRTPEEETLAGIWSEVLGRERVGVEDDFFELGGHSLLAVRLASRIRDAFGVSLPLRDLFGAPTVAAVAARLTDPPDRGARRSGSVPAAAPRITARPRAAGDLEELLATVRRRTGRSPRQPTDEISTEA